MAATEGLLWSLVLLSSHICHLDSWEHGPHEDFNGPGSSGRGQSATSKTRLSLSCSQHLESAGCWRKSIFPSGQKWRDSGSGVSEFLFCLPGSLWDLSGETWYFVVLFLSVSQLLIDYMAAVVGMNNRQEFREDNLAKDPLLPMCKRWPFFKAHRRVHGEILLNTLCEDY